MIKNHLSNRQKTLPRLARNIFQGMPLCKAWNWLKYDWGVFHKEELNFIPPVFVATITRACNLKCPTCLYLLGEENIHNEKSYMTVEFFEEALKQNNAQYADIIFLTGGEPLLHKDFESFVDISKRYGLKVKISTNGIFISKNISFN